MLRVCHPRPLPWVSIPARASKRLRVWPTCRARWWRIPAAWSGIKAAEPFPTKKCQRSHWFSTPRTFAYESSQLPCHLHSLSTNQLFFSFHRPLCFPLLPLAQGKNSHGGFPGWAGEMAAPTAMSEENATCFHLLPEAWQPVTQNQQQSSPHFCKKKKPQNLCNSATNPLILSKAFKSGE